MAKVQLRAGIPSPSGPGPKKLGLQVLLTSRSRSARPWTHQPRRGSPVRTTTIVVPHLPESPVGTFFRVGRARVPAVASNHLLAQERCRMSDPFTLVSTHTNVRETRACPSSLGQASFFWARLRVCRPSGGGPVDEKGGIFSPFPSLAAARRLCTRTPTGARRDDVR